MGIVDRTGVHTYIHTYIHTAQDIGGRCRATREGLILPGKWVHRKRKSKKEASATAITSTAITHKLIKESDKL
jgi:hypothetical protein